MKKTTFLLLLVMSLVQFLPSTVGAAWNWQNPSPTGVNLMGVWGSSEKNVFGVGDHGTILHFDGDRWCTMSSGVTNSLITVWGASAKKVFAGGEAGTILRFDGLRWSSMASGTTEDINAIWGTSPKSVYAVSNSQVLHFDGRQWKSVYKESSYQSLTGIWGSSENDIWVVGLSNKLLHFDGTQWGYVSINASYEVRINKICGASANNIFVSGSLANVLHYDGHTWTLIEHTDNQYASIFSIWIPEGSTKNEFWMAVGAGYGQGEIVHWNNGEWDTVEGLDSILYGSYPHSIYGIANGEIFAVGANGLIVHYDGSNWGSMRNRKPIALAALWGTSDNNVYAAGYLSGYHKPTGGGVLHYDGKEWKPEWVPQYDIEDSQLLGIHGTAKDDIWAVGHESSSRGIIYHFDGTSWSINKRLSWDDDVAWLYAVWAYSRDIVFTAGNKKVFRYDGISWTTVFDGASDEDYYNFHSIWGLGPSDIYLGASYKGILHYNGTNWNWILTSEHLIQRVWGTDKNNIYALVGSDLLHYDGANWSKVIIPCADYLIWSFYGLSADNIYAIGRQFGGDETIAHFDGISWEKISSTPYLKPFGNNDRFLFASPNQTLFIGIGRGVIWHYAPQIHIYPSHTGEYTDGNIQLSLSLCRSEGIEKSLPISLSIGISSNGRAVGTPIKKVIRIPKGKLCIDKNILFPFALELDKRNKATINITPNTSYELIYPYQIMIPIITR